jgi:hypothetical protein
MIIKNYMKVKLKSRYKKMLPKLTIKGLNDLEFINNLTKGT